MSGRVVLYAERGLSMVEIFPGNYPSIVFIKHQISPDWFTLIGRGPTLAASNLMPKRTSSSHPKPPTRFSLVLNGIRAPMAYDRTFPCMEANYYSQWYIVPSRGLRMRRAGSLWYKIAGTSNTLKLSTNESRASLELDQWEWRSLWHIKYLSSLTICLAGSGVPGLSFLLISWECFSSVTTPVHHWNSQLSPHSSCLLLPVSDIHCRNSISWGLSTCSKSFYRIVCI